MLLISALLLMSLYGDSFALDPRTLPKPIENKYLVIGGEPVEGDFSVKWRQDEGQYYKGQYWTFFDSGHGESTTGWVNQKLQDDFVKRKRFGDFDFSSTIKPVLSMTESLLGFTEYDDQPKGKSWFSLPSMPGTGTIAVGVGSAVVVAAILYAAYHF